MQIRHFIKIDPIIGLLSAGILLSLGRLIQTSLNMPTPPGIGITLSALVVLFYFSWLAFEQKWMPNRAVFTIAIMTFICISLMVIAAKTGNVSGIFAWTGVGLGLGATGLIGQGTFGKPLFVERLAIDKQAALVSNACTALGSLEEALVSKLNLLEAGLEETECETITQTWTRIRTFSGEERFEGSIRVAFAENQKLYNLHLPIYPAFETIPSVWCETEEADLTTDIDTKQTYGVRIRVRRQGNTSESLETNLFVVMSTVADSLADVA